MKRVFVIIMILIFSFAKGQTNFTYGFNFDGSYYSNFIEIDSLNSDNNWEVGKPTQFVFNPSYSIPNGILTHPDSAYTTGDTSVFYLYHPRDTQPFHVFRLQFYYKTQTDSGADYGMIEVSGDDGKSWFNILTEDTIYDITWHWPDYKPSFTGTTIGWKYCNADLSAWGTSPEAYPQDITSDTIIFKFSFISDTIPTNKAGWIIDDFYIEDWYEGIEEYGENRLIKVFPNPASRNFNIQINSEKPVSITIYSSKGKLIMNRPKYKGGSLSTENIPPGIYFIKAQTDESISVKKLIIKGYQD